MASFLAVPETATPSDLAADAVMPRTGQISSLPSAVRGVRDADRATLTKSFLCSGPEAALLSGRGGGHVPRLRSLGVPSPSCLDHSGLVLLGPCAQHCSEIVPPGGCRAGREILEHPKSSREKTPREENSPFLYQQELGLKISLK